MQIYAKIWANRLKTYLVEFIAEDQARLLPGRQLRNNVRCILNTIEYYDKNPGREAWWFFIDAEKAFNNINWRFLSSVMEKLDLDPNILNAVLAIYQNQLAAIKINNDTSS